MEYMESGALEFWTNKLSVVEWTPPTAWGRHGVLSWLSKSLSTSSLRLAACSKSMYDWVGEGATSIEILSQVLKTHAHKIRTGKLLGGPVDVKSGRAKSRSSAASMQIARLLQDEQKQFNAMMEKHFGSDVPKKTTTVELLYVNENVKSAHVEEMHAVTIANQVAIREIKADQRAIVKEMQEGLARAENTLRQYISRRRQARVSVREQVTAQAAALELKMQEKYREKAAREV